MYPLVVLAVTSFIVALLATPLVRDCALALGWVDVPDGKRKAHRAAIPRVGGIPIVLAYGAALIMLAALPTNASMLFRSGFTDAFRLLPAAALVFLVGLADDIRDLSPWQKLGVEGVACALAIAAGLRITHIAGTELPYAVSIGLTALWLIGCANAFNLIDGVDGLAAGAGLFAASTMLIAALLQNNAGLVYATAPLVGALLGFLRFNFNPATIFLGDSGSLVIGFLLGCLGINWSQKSATALGLTAPLMALAIPLLDTSLSIARRYITNQPIFSPDRGHIHHRLLDRGFTPRRVALSLYGACGLAAAFSLITSVSENYMAGLVVIIFCAFTWIGIQHLGYVEFGLAGRLFLDGSIRRLVNAQMELRNFDAAMEDAETSLERWNAVRNAARSLGFCRVAAKLGEQRFDELLAMPEVYWSLRITLGSGDFVELYRATEQVGAGAAVAPFADAIQQKFSRLSRPVSTPSYGESTVPSRGTYVVLPRPTSVGKSVL